MPAAERFQTGGRIDVGDGRHVARFDYFAQLLPGRRVLLHLRHRRQRRVLQAVATFEFLKGVFVMLMGFCALALVHKDVWLYAESLLALFHISTDRHSAQLFLDFADNVTDAKLWAAARIAFAYTVLRFTEGYGLWRCRTWAEWVALVSGTLLMPLEVRELLRGVTLLRSALFLGNVAVVLFMLYVILGNRRERRMTAAGSTCD